MMRRLFSLLLPGLLMLALPACAGLTYSAEPIEAWVIDTETKKPLEGVVVTANWQLEQGTMGGNIQVGQLMVMETVTDKEGRFSFPGFGPKLAVTSHLVNDDPQLLLFKQGYEYRRLNNPYSSAPELRLRPDRRSDWNGKTIELKPFKGTTEEYARHLSYLDSLIYSIIGPIDSTLRIDCEWKKIPRLIVAVHKQALFFHEEHIRSYLHRIQDLPNDDEKCGSLKEFFKEYLP